MAKDQEINLSPSARDHIAAECKTSSAKLSFKEKMIIKLRTNRLHKNQRVKQLKCWRQKFRSFIKSKQRHYLESYGGSTCEFSCPICLEMLMTPCPTSCGHVFCFQCIDESIIRTGSCPTCRNYIRSQEFIESEPLSKLSHYFWITSSEKQSYLEKYEKNQQWLKSRRIDKQNIKINDLLDAKDTEHIWCKVKVLNIFTHNQKTDLLIHFEGWNEIYDEVININSQRLAPYNFFSQRQDIPRYRLSSAEDNMRSRIEYGDFRDRLMERGRNGPESMRDVNINIQFRRTERRSLLHYLNFSNLRPSINVENHENSMESGSIRSSVISESELSDESEALASEQSEQQNEIDPEINLNENLESYINFQQISDESINQQQNQNDQVEQMASSSYIPFNFANFYEPFRAQMNALRSRNSEVEQLPLVAPNFDVLDMENIEAEHSNSQQQDQQNSVEPFEYPSNVNNADVELGQLLNSSDQAHDSQIDHQQNKQNNLKIQLHQSKQDLAADDDQTRHKDGDTAKILNKSQKNITSNVQYLQGAELSSMELTLKKFPSSFSLSKERLEQKQKQANPQKQHKYD